MTDNEIREILKRTRTIACVGVSANPTRPSYYVARYLSLKGFTVYPVNPTLTGQRLFGKPIVGSLAELPAGVQMLDIFRRPEHVPALVDEALECMPDLETIWMQIGIVDTMSAAKARAQGKHVVMDRCPKIEYQRLSGELRMGGFATGVISSKL